jgi:hypothetical protein
MLVVGALLERSGRLHVVYPLMALVGTLYSFRLLPWSSGERIRWLRLKDILFVKNLAIGVSWTSAVFVAPLLDVRQSRPGVAAAAIVANSYGLLIVENSIFCDLRRCGAASWSGRVPAARSTRERARS